MKYIKIFLASTLFFLITFLIIDKNKNNFNVREQLHKTQTEIEKLERISKKLKMNSEKELEKLYSLEKHYTLKLIEKEEKQNEIYKNR